MIKLTQVYRGMGHLEQYLKDYGFDRNQVCLVKIFTSSMNQEEAFNTAREMKALLPNSLVVGASSALAVIYDGKQLDNETIIMIEVYNKLKVQAGVFLWNNKTAFELAKEVHSAFGKEDEHGIVHILFSNSENEIDGFVEEINKLTPQIKLAGGIAGNLFCHDLDGFVFTDKEIVTKGAIAFSAMGMEERAFTKVNTSQEAISPVYEITKSSGTFIEEIEHESALNWIYDYLNIEEKQSFSDWTEIADKDYLVHFPFILEGANAVGRYTKYDEKNKKLATYFAKLPAGTKFRVGYVNPAKTIRESHELCAAILDVPVESIFVYSCLFRKLYLRNCAEWELTPFEKYNVCGIFMMSEIAFQNGRNDFYNGCCSMVGVAEEERYVLPNTVALEKASIIEDDESFLKKALEKQKELLNIKHSGLISNLMKRFNENQGESYIDIHTKVPNILQYNEDKNKYHFNKLCMVQIETADATIALVGQEQYFRACRHMFARVREFIKEWHLENVLSIYILNYKTFVFPGTKTVADSHFIDCIQNLYENFETVTLQQSGIFGVAKFVVVLNQEDMLEVGLNVLFANKDSQTNFLVCDQDMGKDLTASDELRRIELLKRAIDKNSVIPFYQGIYNNKTKKIDKYEALMRIVDIDGKIYAPFSFMDVAKKYKFYSKISRMVIERALNDFYDRKECVSINISFYDIKSASFRQWLLGKLKEFPNPERIVIEFVETEDYKNMDVLFEFVEQIHEVGSKIAIDDFGSGYSTFSTIVKLKPDFIKIDGSIVKETASDYDSLIILDTIRYLAEKMDTLTVAEFVENKEIQNIVTENGISHSQGYYFARPVPISEL